MEKRKSERVQFFQIRADNNIQPIWVFNRSNPDAILGLLLDITPEGAQILTNKSQQLGASDYRLVILSGEIPAQELLSVDVHLCWSRQEGSLYVRNGFGFDEEISVQPLLSARSQGAQWLRCELLLR